MGMKKAYFEDGTSTDSTWFENDGIVNKKSMYGPTTGIKWRAVYNKLLRRRNINTWSMVRNEWIKNGSPAYGWSRCKKILKNFNGKIYYTLKIDSITSEINLNSAYIFV